MNPYCLHYTQGFNQSDSVPNIYKAHVLLLLFVVMLIECVNPDDLLAQVTLKITDFDEVKEIENTTTMSFKGTFAWMAPEVVEDEKFSKASDVYR